MAPTLTRKKPPNQEVVLAARDWFIEHANARPALLNWRRLDQAELVETWKQCRTDLGGINLGSARTRDRFEALVETAAGYEPGHFARLRAEAEEDRKFAQLASRARAIGRPSPVAEQSFLLELCQHVRQRNLYVERVPTLVLIVG